MTKKLSVSIFLVLIGLSCLVLVVQAQTPCPSACTCMLPSDAAKMKGYSLCGGKQVICGYDKTQNPLYCYQKPATTTTTTKPTTTQITVVTTALPPCPSGCSCLVPADANKMGYTPCGGKQTLCGYDQYQNPKYCYQKPATTAPVATTTKPTTTPTTAALTTCPSTCSCLGSSDANKMGYTLCGGKQTLCGYDQYQNPQYCYQKPATITPVVTTTKPTTTPATTPALTTCPSTCSCLLTNDGKKSGYTLCGGKQTLCGYDQYQNPQYCFQKPHTTTPQSPPAGTMTPDIVTTFQPPAETAQITGIPTTMMESSVTQEPRIFDTSESIHPTQSSTTPIPEPVHQEIERGGVWGIIDTIVNFFSSLFSRNEPPHSTPSQRVVCNGILTDLMADPENCGECGIVCPSGQCTMGVCRDVSGQMTTCGPLQVLCNGTCTYLMSDENNCGRCGNVCTPPYQQCCSGWCIRPCDPGEICIEGGCRNTSSDNRYCGDRWERCDYHSVCCEGACRNLSDDEQNCGECGYACNPDFTCCSGTCVNLRDNDDNCGACGNRCPVVELCCKGTCCNTSAPWNDFICCRDGCTDILSDRDNCGRCGDACPAGEECYGATCLDPEVHQARAECWNESLEMYRLWLWGEITDREYSDYFMSRENCDTIGA